MKKRVFQCATAAFFLCCAFFTGCENFLNGDEIKDDVIRAIEYGNSPYYTIHVEAVKGSGTIKGNEELQKRVSDTFTVKFDPEDDHKFIKWEAVIPDIASGESVSDYIVFEEPKNLETNVTLKKACSNILIRPICPAKLNASLNLSDADARYPRDSIIILNFSREISDECLEDIVINIPNLPDGKTFRDFYREPEKDGNMVVFKPKIDWEDVNENDLIPMEENEIKTITVQLPSDKIFYENTDYTTTITQYIEKDVKFTFNINSDINKAPLVDVYLNGSNGKFYPAKGKYTVKQFQKNQIEFEPDSDYGFIRWQIYNTATNEEIPDGYYIKISDPYSEKTSYTLLQLPESNSINGSNVIEGEIESNYSSLAIRPVVCERPQVISNSPSYSSAGVLRDTTIQVMFDYDMDPDSIYYTSDESNELSYLGYELLSTNVGGEDKYYGYIKDDETYFKNISIINSRNNANLAQRFKAPVFENTRTLAIPVESSLTAGMNVMVTIEKDFFRSVEYNSEGDTKPVSMSQATKWLYLVNGQSDTTAPVFEDGFPIVYDSAFTEIVAGNQPTVSVSNVSTLKFFKAGEFKLALRAHDDTAPSSNFIINLRKIYDASYNAITTPVTSSQSKEYTSCYGANAIYGNEETDPLTAEICKLDTKNLTDGVYGMSITIKDLSGNSRTSNYSDNNTPNNTADDTQLYYYFCLDSTPPNIAAPIVTDGATAKQFVVKWNKSDVVDYKNTNIKWRKWGSSDSFTTSGPITGDSYTITGLTEGTRYEIVADYSDIAGNIKSAPVTGGAYTRPAAPKSITLSSGYGAIAAVNATKPDVGNCTNLRIRYRVNGTSAWTEHGSRITFTSDSTTGTQSFTPGMGYKYDIEVCTYDSASGKYSDPYSTTTSGTSYPLFTAQPNAPSTFVLQTRNPTSMTIKWNAPISGNYTGYVVKCSTDSTFNSESTQTKTITSASTTTATFTELTAGTAYYFRISAYYDNQNNINSFDSGVYYSRCSAATNLTAVSVSNSSINVSWTTPAGNYNAYTLYYKKHSETSYSSVRVSKGVKNTNLTGLEGGNSYDVYLETNGNIVAQSNTTAVVSEIKTHPNPVTNLQATKVSGSNTNYTVTWSAPTSGEYTGYKLYTATSVAELSSVSPTSIAASSSVSKSLTGTANVTYYIKVKTLRTVGSQTLETETDPICCSLALDAVKSLSATAKSTTSIQLSWTNPNSEGYDGIRVYKGNDLIADSASTSGFTKESTSYTVTGLKANTNYSFTVTTYKNDTATNTELKANSIVSRFTLANQVGSLTAKAAGPTSVTLEWINPDADTWSQVYIYKDGSYLDYWYPYHNRTSATYNVSTGGTKYTFEIRSVNGNNVVNSTGSKTATVTTPAAPVTNLTTTSVSTTSVTLSWTNPTGNYTGVRVYKKLNSEASWPSSAYATYTNKTTTSCTVSGLTAGNTYDFKVESYYSNIPNVADTSVSKLSYVNTLPNAPGNFVLSSRTSTSLTYTWTKPSGGLSGYTLYYKKSSASSYSSVGLSSSTTSYTISDLTQGATYNVYLESYYSSSSNSKSTSTSTKATLPGTPGNFTVSIDGTGTKVSWTAPSGGLSGYYLYYKTGSGSYSSVYTTSTSYTFSNTDLTGGALYYFYIQTYNAINSEYLYSQSTSVKSIYTPPRVLTFSTNPYIYQDDGMGTVTLRWVNYSGRSDVDGINIYLDGGSQRYTYLSYANGSSQTVTIKIPSYSRGSSHYFYFEPYHNKNSGQTKGPQYSTGNLYTTYGSLKINGTEYSYSILDNVTTTLACYTGADKETNDDGAFYKGRKVYLSKFSIGRFEVTQQLYKAVMGTNPTLTNSTNTPVNDYYPVTQVNWYHAIAFCNKLSVLQGLTPCYTISGYSTSDWASITHSNVPTASNDNWNKASFNQYANGYHLPTECQFEFAQRGGSYTLYANGNVNNSNTNWNYKYPGSNTLGDVAWTSSNSSSRTHQVGTKSANVLGLYDLSGNVREWLTDWNNNVPSGTYYDPYCGYNTSTNGGTLCSAGYCGTIARKDGNIVTKGTNWDSTENGWCDSNGDTHTPTTRDKFTGFRLCRNVTY